MRGLHLTADLRGCPPHPALDDAVALRLLCLAAVKHAGLRPVGELFHAFAGEAPSPPARPGGVTGVVLLAESHLAVHTWPELDAVTIDVYVCNVGVDNTDAAQALLDDLAAAFAPAAVERHRLQRGALASVPGADAP